MKNTLIIIVIISFAAFFIGCAESPTELEDYDPQPVLSAFLYNGEPVGDIQLQRVQSLYGYYDENTAGITDAEIILFSINPPAGSSADTVTFTNQGSDGNYSPDNPCLVQGKTVYRIEVTTGAGEFLWAETTVPDTFTLFIIHPNFTLPVALTPNSGTIDTLGIFNRDMAPLLFAWTDSDSTGGYVGNNICLTPVDELVGLDPGWEPEDLEDIEEPSRVRVDFYLSQQTFQEYPWIAFQWEGWHRYEFMAVDKEYFDYVFSFFRTQQGVMTEPLYNVHGEGLGIFAGCCKTDFILYMQKLNY